MQDDRPCPRDPRQPIEDDAMVFFHEVTVSPNTVEGTHQHIGSEELYYITEGAGFAYKMSVTMIANRADQAAALCVSSYSFLLP